MKRKAIVAIAAFFVLICTSLAVSAEQKAAKQTKELPWYFPPGVIQTTNPVKQRQEYLRYYTAQRRCYNDQGVPSMIPGSDSIQVRTDVVSTSSMTKNPGRLTLVFDHHVLTDQETIKRKAEELGISEKEAAKRFKYRFTSFCEQRFVSEHEFEVEKNDLFEQGRIASKRDSDYFKDTEPKAVQARALELGVKEEEFRKYLDEKYPGTDITYREYNLLPNPSRLSDFVPLEIHLASSPRAAGVLGLIYLNTGRVWYNMQGRVRDHLVGFPDVLQHEIIHANINLEDWPLADAFDAELVASIPEMLYPSNQLDLGLPGHSYTREVRELIHVHFGFNFEQAEKEIFKFNEAGQIVIDEEKWNQYAAELDKVRPVLLKFFEEKAFPELYSKRLWWGAMHNILSDDNAWMRMIMANNFQLCGLGGCKETMLWLQARDEKIREWAKAAFEKSKKRQGGGDSMSDMRPPQFMIDIYQNAFSEKGRKELEKRCLEDQGACKALLSSPQKLIEFLKTFKAEREQREQGGVR